MSDTARPRLVYDCNIYLQFLFNLNGPSGKCVRLALDGKVELFVSDPVLDELREMPEKPFCLRNGITDEVVEDFIADLLPRAKYLKNIPTAFEHPIDPDDSAYVNLAIAAEPQLIVSRDNHLLNLMNPAKAWSADFRTRFPGIRVL